MTTPGGTVHRGAPMALAKEQPYSPGETPRDWSQVYRYKRNPTTSGSTANRVGCIEELLEQAEWSIPSIASDGQGAEGTATDLDFERRENYGSRAPGALASLRFFNPTYGRRAPTGVEAV
jgi:hypothetical protein